MLNIWENLTSSGIVDDDSDVPHSPFNDDPIDEELEENEEEYGDEDYYAYMGFDDILNV